ncbi:MAG: hypothetical protein HY558_04400 [Euryarchaeota archaeon]|nr:hypothetical protein [Euryarchaeota archaeon]
MEERRWTLLLLAVSLGAVGLLVLLSAASGTPRVDLSDLPLHEGRRVEVSGRVVDVRPLSGGLRVDLQENGSRARVLVEEVRDLRLGDLLTARGRVQNYRGTWEVAAEGALRTIPGPGRGLSLHQVAQEAPRLDGVGVRVQGTVARNSSTGFTLSSGEVDLRVETGAPHPARGSRVWADGVLRYNTSSLAYRLEGSRWELSGD